MGDSFKMKIITVHRGARDGYQVSRALSDAGLLEALITDLYWPADRVIARTIERVVPSKLSTILRSRHAETLPSGLVTQCWGTGVVSAAAEKTHWLPFHLARAGVRWCDRTLGACAGRLATERRAAILSYSYYAHSAFSNYNGNMPRILFQLHPHPTSVRAILRQERVLNPDCASSLDKEWELALPEEDFARLIEETALAQHWVVASQFTKRTLIEAGIPPDRIGVIPYGIDLDRFTPRRRARVEGKPLQLLFVGTLGQRKGIKYLLQALELLPAGSVELTMCGRAVDDLAMLRNNRIPIRLRPSISPQGLLEAYRSADVFVFPSLAEGFGHVLLEAMATGLSIISTARTAAPDLITHGEEGFIVGPGDASELATRIEEFLRIPEKVESMGRAARRRAEHFTWSRFRDGVAGFVGNILSQSPDRVGTETCLQR
jgi:glycosyltransferase involved in cell wall biosynthesis